MAKNFSYKKNLTTTMVIKGVYDADDMIISNDEADISLEEKLKVFEGAPVSITVKVTSEEDLGDA